MFFLLLSLGGRMVGVLYQQAGKKHGQQQLLATALGHAANGKEVVDSALRGWGEGGGYGAAALVACQSEPWQPPSSAAAAAACEPHANNARGQQLAAPWDPDLKIEQQLMESSRSLRPAAKFQDQEVGFPSNLELLVVVRAHQSHHQVMWRAPPHHQNQAQIRCPQV